VLNVQRKMQILYVCRVNTIIGPAVYPSRSNEWL